MSAATLAQTLTPPTGSGAVRTFNSDLLGPLDYTPGEPFHFAHGLLGFPDCHEYLLVRAEREGLYWLQSLEHSALTFALADPFLFFDGYAVDLGENVRREIGDPEPIELLILAIVTLPRSAGGRPTANLQGPLLFNLATRAGRQTPLPESLFGVREPFSL